MLAMTFQDRPSPSPLAEPESPSLSESPLLHTKLRMPCATPTLLSRPRLTAQLRVPPNGYLTLLSAPAGFGKTTLIVDWLREHDYPVAWLTLDEHDNDPVLFWRYLLTALQRADARLGLQAQAALRAPMPVSLETIVTLLLNDVIAYIPADTVLILVLDDFHWIHNAAIQQSLNYLLQHQPSQLHLVLLTRADPVLSLARLRVEGRLLELRAADLRLTMPEISAFLAGSMGLELPEEVLALLAQQTEGWPAGLQLAALSLRQRDAAGTRQLVQSFSGAQPHVFAYLLEEVLNHQPEEVRCFLQQTAVLGQFSAPLCTAVTGQADAARLLARLTAENLFITPLDDQGEWYRYHPLFAEMLQANLDEASRRECHRRAARWFAEHRLAQDAIRHAQTAGDYELMAALLTQTYKGFWANGLLVSVQKWFDALPAAYQTPRLRLVAAWARLYESNEAELRQIIAEISAEFPEEALDPALRGEMLAIQAIYASLYGRPEQAIAWANEALPVIDPADWLSQAAVYQALGNAHRYQGHLPAALTAYGQAKQRFEQMGQVFMAQLPVYRMAHIHILQGRLHQALRTYEQVRERALAAGTEPLIASGEIYGHLSDLYWEWNDLEQAVAYAEQEIELARPGHFRLALVNGCLCLAAARSAQGEEQAARDALEEARQTAGKLQSPGLLAQVAMAQARHDLAWGHVAAAASWAAGYVYQRYSGNGPLPPLLLPTADVMLARVWLAQGHALAALELLQEITPQLEAAGRMRLLVEANVLQALACQAQGRLPAARQAIIQALTLARQEGYIRTFVENGPAMRPLLAGVAGLFPDDVPQLLAALPEGDFVLRTTQMPAELLLDPLTGRELEILSLIAQGCSNRQIADKLVISVGTVKGHVNHILSKLDAPNRTGAVARARDLSLLDV